MKRTLHEVFGAFGVLAVVLQCTSISTQMTPRGSIETRVGASISIKVSGGPPSQNGDRTALGNTSIELETLVAAAVVTSTHTSAHGVRARTPQTSTHKLGASSIKSHARTIPRLYADANTSANVTAEFDLSAYPTIVFESYDGRRPDAADLPIGALLKEFDKLGYAAAPSEVWAELGSQLPLPARANPKLTKPKLSMELENAHMQFLGAREFTKLASVLERAVTDALENPVLMVNDSTLRNKFQDALLDLALVRGKLARDTKHAEDVKQLQLISEDTMAEWVRTFSDVEVTQGQHGPDAERLYTRVRSSLDKFGRGALVVTVDDPNVQLYRSSSRSLDDRQHRRRSATACNTCG